MHVWHHCVLRFQLTTADDLLGWVSTIYDYYLVREADGAYLCSQMKFSIVQSPLAPFRTTCNSTVNAQLQDISRICSSHYATFNIDELDKLYGHPFYLAVPPTTPPGKETVPSSPGPLRDHTELLDLFVKYSSDSEADTNRVQWPESDLTKEDEDQFVKHGVQTGKRNAFSSTAHEATNKRDATSSAMDAPEDAVLQKRARYEGRATLDTVQE